MVSVPYIRNRNARIAVPGIRSLGDYCAIGEGPEGGEREPGVTRPPLTAYYFFLAVFFFELPFFFAFFFAAIIVSFKVNLGMLYRA